MRRHPDRFDPIDLALLGQKPQGDRRFHFEAEVAELTQGQRIGLLIDGLHRHRRGAALEPGLMVVQVRRHCARRRQHLHGIGEAAAVTAHLRISGVAQVVDVGARQKHHDRW